MKVATVFDNSEPVSIILKHKGIISVCNKKLTISASSTLTSAPITPRDVSLKYSNGRCLDTVFKKGYKYRGIWAINQQLREIFQKRMYLPLINLDLVSGWDATHCNKANALHTRLLAWGDRVGGDNIGNIATISWRRTDMIPTECHNTGAKSGNDSRFLLNSNNADSL